MSDINFVNCISVSQPVGTFYVTAMKAGELLGRVDILRRGLEGESREHVQRELSKNRTKEIAAYVADPDATFPTSVIVAAYREHIRVVPGGTQLVFGKTTRAENGKEELDDTQFDPGLYQGLAPNDKIGEVIDGQHRLEGLRLAGADEKGSPYFNFELPVVFMMDTAPEDRAYVFSTINSKHTRVPSSLIYDLFGLTTTRSPHKTCHDVARALNATESSPFYKTLKMLGKKNLPTESLTQGSFAKYLLNHVSRTPEEDERKLKRGDPLTADPRCIFREFFINEEDELIVKALTNFFSAISAVYPVAWRNTEDYALKRTVGLQAFMRVLELVWRKEVIPTRKATLEVFMSAAEQFRKRVPEDSFKGITSSGGAATKLFRELTEQQ